MPRTKSIPFAPGIRLPVNLVTQKLGILAVSGAGKSNVGAVLAEEMHKGGLPFAIIDPPSDYWGLRSSKDGKGPGLPIPIFGGDHGDVPLERTGGKLMADILLDEGISCIIDVSEFEGDEASRKAQIQFLTDFARRLYARAKRPEAKVPLHLILEEAEVFMPQKPMREQVQCLSAWGHIVRRGRSRGIGTTMISQRSALLNKDMLTQCNTLIVLRTPAPQDRKAIKEWVDAKGIDPEMMASLPALEDGEAWIWSPRWLKKFERVQMRRRETYDSGAAPEFTGRRRRPPTLAEINLDSLRERMSETISRAKGRDPRALQVEVKRLERELATARREAERPRPAEPKRVEVPILKEVDRRYLKNTAEIAKEAAQEARKAADKLTEQSEDLQREVGKIETALQPKPPAPTHAPPPARARPQRPPEPRTASRGAARAPEGGENGETPLKAGALRMVKELCRVHPMKVTKAQLATLSNLTASGGSYQGNIGLLLKGGLAEVNGKEITATSEALDLYGHGLPETPRTPGEVQSMWRARLHNTAARIFDELIHAYPKGVGKQTLADQIGATASGGSFQGHIGTLRRNGLAEVRQGVVYATGAVFMEGVA